MHYVVYCNASRRPPPWRRPPSSTLCATDCEDSISHFVLELNFGLHTASTATLDVLLQDGPCTKYLRPELTEERAKCAILCHEPRKRGFHRSNGQFREPRSHSTQLHHVDRSYNIRRGYGLQFHTHLYCTCQRCWPSECVEGDSAAGGNGGVRFALTYHDLRSRGLSCIWSTTTYHSTLSNS
jgi:hypothetical protein